MARILPRQLESEPNQKGNLEASVRSAAQHFVRTVADLIEAGLNEDAGRFALALLWALCRAASECRRVGLQPCEASMIVLMSDRSKSGFARAGSARQCCGM